MVYLPLQVRAVRPANPVIKGQNLSIARTLPTVVSRRHARTGGQRKMSGRLFGYARVSVASDADANNLETQRRVLADCEQVFEDVGSGASLEPAGAESAEGRPPAGRLREGGGAGLAGSVADRGAAAAGWLREKGVDIASGNPSTKTAPWVG